MKGIYLTEESKQVSDESTLIKANEPFGEFRKEAVYQYHASPMIKYANEEKKFICKGKHQYTNINGEWICQCGRKTTD
jgi:hypothetical protein